MARVRCIGGPADGGLQYLKSGSYIWIDREGEKRYDHFPGAGLYRITRDAYVYCGNRIIRCRCGAYVPKDAGECRLCGARV